MWHKLQADRWIWAQRSLDWLFSEIGSGGLAPVGVANLMVVGDSQAGKRRC